MSFAQILSSQWQGLALATWLLFLWVLLAGTGAFSLATALIVIPSFRATQAMAYDKSGLLARLFPLRPLFVLGAVVMILGALATLFVLLSAMYSAVLPFWPRVWV